MRASAREARDEHVIEIRTNVGQATEHLRRAGRDIAEAGEAGVALARDTAAGAMRQAEDVVETVRERAGEVVGRAQETAAVATESVAETGERAAETAERVAKTAGRAAVGLTVTALHLPRIVRQSARRSVELAEEMGTQLASSVLSAGSRALNAAADYVSEIVPRRRVRRAALERLVLEQIAWAEIGADVLERIAGRIDDDALRVRLVHAKLQTIRNVETLVHLLGRIGGRRRDAEKPRVQPAGEGVRHDLATALWCAEQQADGWRALVRIGAAAEPDSVADAIAATYEAVGSGTEEQVSLLRQAVVERTVESVLL